MSNTEVKLDEASNSSLTDQAYRQLEELIVTVQLKPGSVLSELALAAQLGIGRTPIREALHRLAREGLVVILPRRGIHLVPRRPGRARSYPTRPRASA